MEKYLHIVCLDVPYPVDCKSAFIMFYEIKALYEKGVKIYLHCFEYSRPRNNIMNMFCEKLYYYPKHKGHKGLSLSLPYIVSSRANKQLTKNLQEDNYPILVHGIHSTFFLTEQLVPERKTIVRLHYAEHVFYNHLAKLDKSLLKKIYYNNESRLLKCYEQKISSKASFAALTNETKKI